VPAGREWQVATRAEAPAPELHGEAIDELLRRADTMTKEEKEGALRLVDTEVKRHREEGRKISDWCLGQGSGFGIR
jgi:hypothetical protein